VWSERPPGEISVVGGAICILEDYKATIFFTSWGNLV
jgi:hypothetical protein